MPGEGGHIVQGNLLANLQFGQEDIPVAAGSPFIIDVGIVFVVVDEASPVHVGCADDGKVVVLDIGFRVHERNLARVPSRESPYQLMTIPNELSHSQWILYLDRIKPAANTRAPNVPVKVKISEVIQ